MSKSIEIEIEYTDKDGNDAVEVVTIKKVFNWVMREFDDMNKVMASVTEKMKELASIESQIDVIVHSLNTNDNWLSEREKLQKEKATIVHSIKAVEKTDFFKKRFELATGILKDNKVESKQLYDFGFWDKQVEPSVIINFLTQAVFKDAIAGLKGQSAKK